jgi:hypothetical protein
MTKRSANINPDILVWASKTVKLSVDLAAHKIGVTTVKLNAWEAGGDYYRNIIAKNGQLFLNLALQGYYQEKLSASSLVDFIQVKISNISKLEERLYA